MTVSDASSHVARPNFFIIGAMKSGTTSLHSYLHGHPDIFMCHPKEPSYFVDRSQLKVIWPEMEKRGYWKSEEAYLALFEDAGPVPVIGESSTNYTKLNFVTGVPERLASFAPDAKLLYIMRDPVERTISHYWHNVQLHGESRPLSRAVKEDAHYMEVSYYAMQLKAFLKVFPQEQIKTLVFEEFKKDPSGTLKDIYTWLGVRDDFTPDNLEKKYNESPSSMKQATAGGILYSIRYSRLWSAMGPLIPPKLRSFARKLSEREVRRHDVNNDEVIDFLRPIQQQQVAELEELLNRDFKAWSTLYGTR